MDSIRRLLGCFILLSLLQHFVGGTPDIGYPFGYYDGYGYGYGGNGFPSYGAFIGGSGVGVPFWYFGDGGRDFGFHRYDPVPYTGGLMGGFGGNRGYGYFGGINGRGYGYGHRNAYRYVGGQSDRNYSNAGVHGRSIGGPGREGYYDHSGGGGDGQRSINRGRSQEHNARPFGPVGIRSGGRGYQGANYAMIPTDPYISGMFPYGTTSSRPMIDPYNPYMGRFYRFPSFPYPGAQQMFNPRMPEILRRSHYIGRPGQYALSGRAGPIIYGNNMGGMPGRHAKSGGPPGGYSHQILEPRRQGENRAPYNVVGQSIPPTAPNEPAVVVNDLPTGDGTSPPSSEPVPNPEPPTDGTKDSPSKAGISVPLSDKKGSEAGHGKHDSGGHSASSTNYVVDGHKHP